MKSIFVKSITLCFLLTSIDGISAATETYEQYSVDWSLIEKKARKGDVFSQTALGEYYLIVKNDLVQGERWLLMASKQGDAEAQFNLARLYFGQKKYDDFYFWIEKSVEQQHPSSEYFLGLVMKIPNPELSRSLIARACSHGYEKACKDLNY